MAQETNTDGKLSKHTRPHQELLSHTTKCPHVLMLFLSSIRQEKVAGKLMRRPDGGMLPSSSFSGDENRAR